MNKIPSLYIFLLYFYLIFLFPPCQAMVIHENTTLVVGNVRGCGCVDSKMKDFVFPEDARIDFTHTNSFSESKVISIDLGPCRIKKLKKQHIQNDFLVEPFGNVSFNRVFFEWMPSCGSRTEPLLKPSIEKAFSLLSTGGELVIDHMPYRVALEDDVIAGLRQLKNYGHSVSIDLLRKLPRNAEDRYPGILSRLLQSDDVFTFHRSQRERSDIFNILVGKHRIFENDQIVFCPNIIDTQTNMDAVFNSVLKMAEILHKSENVMYSDLIAELRTELDGTLYLIFEWIYYMFSRKEQVREYLQTIGFIVNEDFLQYYETNPYNGRKHAWIMKVYKP